MVSGEGGVEPSRRGRRIASRAAARRDRGHEGEGDPDRRAHVTIVRARAIGCSGNRTDSARGTGPVHCARMSVRDRTPRPPSAKYITPAGAKKLRDEFDWLWSNERPRVTQQVADAAALGDRSENADYIYGKRRLREIDRRIEFLSKRLEVLTVVTEAPPDRARVAFGAWVTLEDDEGGEARYRLVGPDEFDVKLGLISIDSPVARAVLGRRLGDEVTVVRPKGPATFVIAAVRYEQP
jgi:transcription elongation factor GreB